MQQERSVTQPATPKGPGPGDRRRNIEALFPLRAAQKPFLLYAGMPHRDRGPTDPGFIQVRFDLLGPLDPARLEQAWHQVVDRHAALRMSVPSVPGKPSLLVVWKQVKAAWHYDDWRARETATRADDLARLLREDREHGLNPAQAPVSRLRVVRTEDARHTVIWSCHHLLIDGWSSAIVVQDLLLGYHALEAGRSLPPLPISYRDYAAWEKARDRTALREFWTGYLDGARPMPSMRLADQRSAPDRGVDSTPRRTLTLTAEASALLKQRCAAAGLTPTSLVQGVWALLLGAISDRGDVLFGMTVSGRPPDLAGADSLVGMFAHGIPLRVRLEDAGSVHDGLRQLRDQQLEMGSMASADIQDILDWTGFPPGQALFNTLLVVENFPRVFEDLADGLSVENYRSGIVSSQTLTLSVTFGNRWSYSLDYDPNCLGKDAVDALSATLEQLPHRVLDNLGAPMQELRAWTATTLQGHLPHGLPTSGAGDDASSRGDEESGYVAPRTSLQLQLASVWEEVLGIAPVGITEDFFELGGKSLAAVRLVSLIEERFKCTLPIATVLERRTIEELAEIISDDSVALSGSLVAVRASGNRAPLFCIHAGGEHALYYRHLAHRLGADQPVYALEPPGLNGDVQPRRSLESLAADYVREIRGVQATGPYLLLGYCIGASVALEMARILEGEGERVHRLIVLDSGFWWGDPPVPGHKRLPEARSLGSKIRDKWREGGPAALLHLTRLNLVVLARHVREHLPRWLAARKMAFDEAMALRFGSRQDRRALWRKRTDDACRAAFRRYVPNPCRADITLVRTTEYLAYPDRERHLRWAQMGPTCTVRVVEGEHDTMLEEPTVEQVAAIVGEYTVTGAAAYSPAKETLA